MFVRIDYIKVDKERDGWDLSYNVKIGAKRQGEPGSEADATIMNYGNQGQERRAQSVRGMD